MERRNEEKMYNIQKIAYNQYNQTNKNSICGVWLHRYNVAFQTKISEQTKIM